MKSRVRFVKSAGKFNRNGITVTTSYEESPSFSKKKQHRTLREKNTQILKSPETGKFRILIFYTALITAIEYKVKTTSKIFNIK